MGSFMVPVETAFNITEVMQHARHFEAELIDNESYDDSTLEWRPWRVVKFWSLLGNSVWVPRLLDISRQQKLTELISITPLSLYRNPLVPREDSVSAVTPGVTNALRERIGTALWKTTSDSDGRYSALHDMALWNELSGEAAVDFAFRSVSPTFELRGCAMCGKWYEPLLSNRSRFCAPDCRKRFNNIRNSAKEEAKVFTCDGCGLEISMEWFSGLANVGDEGASPLRINQYQIRGEGLWCVDCVEEHHKEWARYIAPLVDARDAKERAATS